MLSLKKLCGVAVGLLMISAAPTFAAQPVLSATATISSVPDGPNFDYTMKLTNTGSGPIGTFWFAWTPPEQTEYDFLPSDPLSADNPTGWYGYISDGFPGTSIEYYNISGSNIASGQTGTFLFTSPDSPATLQGTQYGFPITESFIYAGGPEVGADAEVLPTFVAVPEPSSALLALIGCGFAIRRRRALRV